MSEQTIEPGAALALPSPVKPYHSCQHRKQTLKDVNDEDDDI